MRHKIGSTKSVESTQGLLCFLRSNFPSLMFEYEIVESEVWPYEILCRTPDDKYLDSIESKAAVIACRALSCGRGELVE